MLDARFLLSIKFAPNDEVRMANDEGSTKLELRRKQAINVRDLSFVIVSSFVIRISAFEQSLVSQRT
jgi:hypothetical protein